MFDPLAARIVRFVKGDPVRVLVGTVLLALAISMDGDGATTYIIVCTTMVPIYKRLNINILILPCLTVLCNGIMNLLPWGGPTARVLSGLDLEANQVMLPYYVAMILANIHDNSGLCSWKEGTQASRCSGNEQGGNRAKLKGCGARK